MEHGSWREMAVVGVVARTHGRHGEVVVNPETDFPEERFRAGGTLFVAQAGIPVAVKIRDAWFHRGRPVVSFERVDTLSAAEGLRGVELRVPDEALQPLPAYTWYEHELVGCVVRTVSGAEVGTVAAVDADAESIVIDPPPGLLEVNRTRAAGGGRRSKGRGTGSDG